MAIGNTWSGVGNLTRDVELRYLPNGTPIGSFGLAVSHRFQKDGQWEEKASFFDISCFGSLGENVSESLTRGSRVMVVGRLEQRSWETQDGDKRSKVEVVADEVGPSLRWATADITKNERQPGGGGNNQRSSAPASGARSNEPPAYDYDEEPF